MSERALVAVVAIVITLLAAMLIAGHGPWAGPRLLALGSGHGLNTGDVPVVVAWATGMGACALLRRRP